MTVRQAFGGLVIAAALAVCACEPTAAPQRCRRHDGVSLTPENRFAAAVESGELMLIDQPEDRIDLAMTVVRPVRGTIDLVHVVGDREMGRWELNIAESSLSTARCFISPGGGWFTCGAMIREIPHPTGGYYYLLSNGNIVLEAGLSFYLCD